MCLTYSNAVSEDMENLLASKVNLFPSDLLKVNFLPWSVNSWKVPFVFIIAIKIDYRVYKYQMSLFHQYPRLLLPQQVHFSSEDAII